MATSRTGTAIWKRVVKEVRERDAHITRCPECGVGLDWIYSGRPNSVEVDHIVSHSRGGQDTADNARVCCRRCNQSLGAKSPRRERPVVESTELESSPIW